MFNVRVGSSIYVKSKTNASSLGRINSEQRYRQLFSAV